METRFFLLFVISCALSPMTGCKPEAEAPRPPSPPPRVAYSTVARERKAEFAAAVAEALRDFDDLYGKVAVSVGDSPEGPVVTVAGTSRAKPEQLERSLGVALANFEFLAPGMRFVATGDSSWKILFPGDMQVAAEGKFDFILP